MTASSKNDEVAIRRLIEDWASAVRAKDINGVVAHHTDDVVMYDVPPPTAVSGISAYRETWPPFFEALTEGEAAFDIVELQITAGDTVASRRHCCDAVRRSSWLRTPRRASA